MEKKVRALENQHALDEDNQRRLCNERERNIDWVARISCRASDGDESDGDDDRIWTGYAIGLGFSVAARTGEITEEEDIEE